MSQTQIALKLGVNQSSISRELKRTTGKRCHNLKQAENKVIQRHNNIISNTVITPETIKQN
ncbi:MAG: helix-turn-helix domain-containing protein [Psychromonas sp.]|nr:helix-turn-helix domain-containing protein [Psychromonas sp.]